MIVIETENKEANFGKVNKEFSELSAVNPDGTQRSNHLLYRCVAYSLGRKELNHRQSQQQTL